jgi:hypothetical protein
VQHERGPGRRVQRFDDLDARRVGRRVALLIPRRPDPASEADFLLVGHTALLAPAWSARSADVGEMLLAAVGEEVPGFERKLGSDGSPVVTISTSAPKLAAWASASSSSRPRTSRSP